MNQIATGIDHPIIAVRDMAAGRAAYERLGFTVTPRGRHLEWGTGNWCIMFDRDYIELRGIIDPANPHNLARILEKREGLMGLAFGTKGAQESYAALAAQGLKPQPVRELTRKFELPEGAVKPRFSLCFLNEAEAPGLMSVVFCQHKTPELLRRPEWLRHANGACGVRAVCGVVPNVAAARDCYSKMFGPQAIDSQKSGFNLRINDRQTISLVNSDAAHNLWPTLSLPPVDDTGYLLSVTLQVNDITATKQFLDANRIGGHLTASDTMWISPADSCGVPLEFTDRGPDHD